MSTPPLWSGEMWDRRAYVAPLFLTLVSLVLFLPGLGARDFWAPGEPIYAEVIRVMYEKNNWLVPMLNGHLYADKPVLYFWLALIVSNIAGGVNEWTVRLPTMVGGVGLVLGTYQFGRTFYDRQTGVLSGLIVATSSRLLWESRFLRLDTVLSLFLFLGFYFVVKAFTEKGSKNYYLLGYLCFALATLTKGPIGVVLPGLAVLSLIAVTGRWREIGKMRLVWGVVIVALLIGPWLGLLHLRGEDLWLKDFIWTHNIQRYALKPLGHVRPFYYYFVNLPPDFLPWTVLVPGALIFYYPWKEKLRNPVNLALLCWFASVFVFFSLSKSKIAYYLLPLMPSLAILVGCYLRTLMTGQHLQGSHWVCTAWLLYFLAGSLGLAGLGITPVVFQLERGLVPWAIPLSAVLIGGSVGMVVFLRRHEIDKWFMSFTVILVAVSVIASAGVLPYLDNYKSPRAIGEFIRSRVSHDAPVYVYQSTMADFNYYAGRESIPVVASGNDLAGLTGADRKVYVVINEKDLKEIKSKVRFDVVAEHQVGRRKWYVLRIS